MNWTVKGEEQEKKWTDPFEKSITNKAEQSWATEQSWAKPSWAKLSLAKLSETRNWGKLISFGQLTLAKVGGGGGGGVKANDYGL